MVLYATELRCDTTCQLQRLFLRIGRVCDSSYAQLPLQMQAADVNMAAPNGLMTATDVALGEDLQFLEVRVADKSDPL